MTGEQNPEKLDKIIEARMKLKARFEEKMKELPTGLRKDLIDIQNYSNSYEDWMPNLQYKMYDAYLKGQGIEEGMLNYNKVIGLVLAYKAANSFILIDSSLPR